MRRWQEGARAAANVAFGPAAGIEGSARYNGPRGLIVGSGGFFVTDADGEQHTMTLFLIVVLLLLIGIVIFVRRAVFK